MKSLGLVLTILVFHPKTNNKMKQNKTKQNKTKHKLGCFKCQLTLVNDRSNSSTTYALAHSLAIGK